MVHERDTRMKFNYLFLVRSESLHLLTTFCNILSHKAEFFEVKLNKIKKVLIQPVCKF